MKKIALAAALICSSGLALAQDINPSWYVGGSAEWMKTDKSYIDKNGWGADFRVGKPIHPYWDIQFDVGQVRANSDNNGDYWNTHYGVDALLMLSRQNVRPYLLIGVGGQHDHHNRLGVFQRNDTSFYYQGGIGVQVGMNDRWTFQADLRAQRGSPDEEKFGFDKSLNKMVRVGFNYALQPPPRPAPAPAPVIEQPAPTPAPTEPPPPPPPAKFEKVTLSATELFGFNSAKLSMPQPRLDEIANVLQQNPSLTDITITGYTDRIGKPKYNQKLSERRANAVREYLVSKGIDGSRLKAVGQGEANPVVTCNQKKRSELIACLAPNRRVEVEQITIEKRVQ
jgi:OOP family OmpA-OmpF porin